MHTGPVFTNYAREGLLFLGHIVPQGPCLSEGFNDGASVRMCSTDTTPFTAKQNVKYFSGNDRVGLRGVDGVWLVFHANGRHGKSHTLAQ